MYKRNEGDISRIEHWILTQKFLPKDLSRDFIFTFLLGCEGDMEKTKNVLSNYFYARQSIPEFFTGRNPLSKENIAAWKASCFVPLKNKLNGCQVFLGVVLDDENFNFVNLVKQAFMCYDLLININEWGNGNRIMILNYEKMKHQNLLSFSTYLTRKAVECARDSFLPGKLRAVHNIFIPSFLKKFHSRCQLDNAEDEEKVNIYHKTLKSLHKYVSPKILPYELGGNAGSLKTIAGDWVETLKKHQNFFIQEEEKRIKETKVRKFED